MIVKGEQALSAKDKVQKVTSRQLVFGLREIKDEQTFYPDFVVPIMRVVGSFCNLRCKYCFFRREEQGSFERMSIQVLEKAITRVVRYNAAKGHSRVEFIWHGGEPLLAGKRFFREVVRIQSSFADIDFINGIQTNATLIDEDWAYFFATHRFQVGVSLDGLPLLHDRYRVNVGGKGSWGNAVRGYDLLRRAGIIPGIIVVVHAESIPFARRIVEFLYYELEARSIAFNPFFDPQHPLNVTPQAFQLFLQEVFEAWLEIGDPDFQIREVDEFLNISQGLRPRGCTFSGRCAHYVSIQPNGEVYACNRLPFAPSLRFGNVLHESLSAIFHSDNYQRFASNVNNPSPKCRRCSLLQMCHSGCTAHRLNGKYYYCEVRQEMPLWLKRRLGSVLESIIKGGASDERI